MASSPWSGARRPPSPRSIRRQSPSSRSPWLSSGRETSAQSHAPPARRAPTCSSSPIRVPTSPAARKPYWAASYAGAVAIALGSERHGLPDVWLEAADEEVAVPLHGPVDSLNVAVAAGVVLCEAARAQCASR